MATSEPSESQPPLPPPAAGPPVQAAIEIAIRVGAIAGLAALCVWIVAPFVGVVIWALVIAIGTEGAFEPFCRLLGGRRNLAAALAIAGTFAVLLVPTVVLTETLTSGAQNFAARVSEGGLQLPAPSDAIKDWPVVGERVYDGWMGVKNDLGGSLDRIRPQLEAISGWLVRAAGSAGAAILEILASILIAGVMLARSPGRQRGVRRFAVRLAGESRGPALADLTTSTVRGVVQGIVGVALIQSLLAGLGLAVAQIPAAGLWALLVLVAAVIQVPVGIVLVVPIVLAFSSLGTGAATAFTIWCVGITLLDNVLKPILFGRGVSSPTIVIFLGSIGGMLAMGIIGLFLGAVVLAVGYELFLAWLAETEEDTPAEVA